MLPYKLADLTLEKIQSLVGNGVRESRTLDFKRDRVGPRDEDKREFLADISAFANTAGGDLLFGVEESGGEAVALPGIAVDNPDEEIRRLQSVERASIEPRLPPVEYKWFPAEPGRGYLLVRVPRSYLAPHRVTFKDHAKFYGRNSAGKYPLDVSELRGAFLSSEGVQERIRQFRRERLAAIEADEGALPLRESPKVVCHIIPLSSFSTEIQLDLERNRTLLPPIAASGGFNSQHTMEGFATYRGREGDPEGVRAYTLLFRSGIVEIVGNIGHRGQDRKIYISSSSVEGDLIDCIDHYKGVLIRLGVEAPWYIFISLLGTRGSYLDHGLMLAQESYPQRKDRLIFPEAVVQDAALPAADYLRPTFDLFWNAYGYPRSFGFDAQGKFHWKR